MANNFLPRSMLQSYEEASGAQFKLQLDESLRAQADAAAEAANSNVENLLAQTVPIQAPGPENLYAGRKQIPNLQPFQGTDIPLLGAAPEDQPQGFRVGLDDPIKLQEFMPPEFKESPGPELPSGPANANVNSYSDAIAKAAKEFGVPKDVIAGIMDIESGGDAKALSPAGAMGPMQVMAMNFKDGEDPWDINTNIRAGTRLLADRYRRFGSWEKAAASYFGAADAEGNITDATDAGGQTGTGYVAAFNDARKKYATTLPDAPDTTANGNLFGITPDQFQAGFDAATAYAACGIVAAMAFAKAHGRMPSPEEARELATTYGGWSIEQGMGGPAGLVNTLAKMGVAAHQEAGIDFSKVKQDLASGNPVVVDTPGHYYVIEAYDPSTGRYKLGNDQDKATPDWATEDDIMTTRWGAPRTTIHADNPASHGLSVANQVNDPDLGPTEDPIDWGKRLGDQLSSGKSQIQNAWNALSDNIASSTAGPRDAAVQVVGDVLNSVGAIPDAVRDASINNPVSQRIIKRATEPGNPLNAGDVISELPQELGFQAAKGLYESDPTGNLQEAARATGTNPGRIFGVTQEQADIDNPNRDPAAYNVVGQGIQMAVGGIAGQLTSQAKGLEAAAKTARVVEEGEAMLKKAQALRAAAVIVDQGEALDPLIDVAGGGIKAALKARGIRPIEGGADRVADLYHYSPSPQSTLDPQFMGTGQMGEEATRIFNPDGSVVEGQVPYNQFYAREGEELGGRVEAHRFGGDYLHNTKIPIGEGGLYETTTTAARPSNSELLDQGYKGLYFKDQGQAHVWSQVEVENLGKSRVTRDQFGNVYAGNATDFLEGGPGSTTNLPARQIEPPAFPKAIEINTRTRDSGGGTWEPSRGWNHIPDDEESFIVGGGGYAKRFPGTPTNNEINKAIGESQPVWSQEGKTFGTWVDDGETFIDVGDKTDNITEAIQLAQRRGQREIWDNANMESIRVMTDEQSDRMKTLLANGLDPEDAMRQAGITPHAPIEGGSVPYDPETTGKLRGKENPYRVIYNEPKNPDPIPGVPRPETNRNAFKWFPSASQGKWVDADSTLELARYAQLEGALKNATPDPLTGDKIVAWDKVDPKTYGREYTQLSGRTSKFAPDILVTFERADGSTYKRLEEIKSDFIGSYDTNISKRRDFNMEHGKPVPYGDSGLDIVYLTNNEIGNNAIRSFTQDDFDWLSGPEWKKLRMGFNSNTLDWVGQLERFEAQHGRQALLDRLTESQRIIREGHYALQNALSDGRDIRKELFQKNVFAPTGDHPEIAGANYDVWKITKYLEQNPTVAGAVLGVDMTQDEEGNWSAKPTDNPIRAGIALVATPQARGALAKALPKLEAVLAGTAPAVASKPPVAASVGDWVKAVRYNSMLSRPATLMLNVVGGGIETVYKPLRDALLQHPETTAFEWLGGMKSFDSALASAAEVFKNGISNSQVARGGDVPQVKLGGPIGTALEVPSRVLGGFDEFFHQLVYGMEAGRKASEFARSVDQGTQVVAGGMKATFSRKLSLQERAGLFDLLMANPTSEITEQALDAANRATFKGEMGQAGEAFQGAVGKLKVHGVDIGNLFAPFIKTPYHIASRGIDRTPLGLVGAIWDGVTGRGTSLNAPSKERIADGIIGTALTIWAYNQALQGNITGTGPSDPRERARAERQGTQWNSFKVGDRWYDYNQLGPWAVPLAAAAAAAESGLYAKKPDEQTLKDRLGDAGARFSEVWTSNGYLSGLGTLGDLLNGRGASTAENFAAQTIGSFLPFGGSINTAAQAQDPSMRAPEGVGERLQNRLPKFSALPGRTDLPEKLDVYGQPRPNPQTGMGAIAPIKSREIRPDPVDAELTRIKANVSEAPKSIGGVELKRDQQQDFQKMSGANIRLALETVMGSEEWSRANDERKKAIVSSVVEDARGRAAELIVAPEDRKITDTGLPLKYEGITDPKEERRIDLIIQKVSEYRTNSRTMDDPGPEPSEEEWDIYGEYRSGLTQEYKDEVKRRALDSKGRKSVPLPFDARKR